VRPARSRVRLVPKDPRDRRRDPSDRGPRTDQAVRAGCLDARPNTNWTRILWEQGTACGPVRGGRRGSNDCQESPSAGNGFQEAWTSTLSNHFSTRAIFLTSTASRQMSTSLGDQGSQVRVPSPRHLRRNRYSVRDLGLHSCCQFRHYGGERHYSAGFSVPCSLDRNPRRTERLAGEWRMGQAGLL
jgi:hypothetical protein